MTKNLRKMPASDEKKLNKYLDRVNKKQLKNAGKVAKHINDTYDKIRMKYLYY